MNCSRLLATACMLALAAPSSAAPLRVSASDTLETQGLSVIVDQNKFSPIFFDEKNAGIQVILHGDRIATELRRYAHLDDAGSQTDGMVYDPKLGPLDRAGSRSGVPVSEGSWAGSNQVATPANNLSLVSTVGTQSKLIAYGHNRADYTFLHGGIVPEVLVIKPNFPELKTDWPFLWFENEYTVSTTSAYILAANAAVAAAAETR